MRLFICSLYQKQSDIYVVMMMILPRLFKGLEYILRLKQLLNSESFICCIRTKIHLQAHDTYLHW